MPNTPKPDPRPLFTPSTLPEPAAPDPVVAFIEDSLLAIANRQDEAQIGGPDPRPDFSGALSGVASRDQAGT